jgi:hypothetical protein
MLIRPAKITRTLLVCLSDYTRQDVSSVADDGGSLIHNLNANIDKGKELCRLRAICLV